MAGNTPLLVPFFGYLLLMVGTGFWARGSSRNLDDHVLGGRSPGSFVTAPSADASDMSGWLLLGLPGAMYLGGASETWIALCLILGASANWRFAAGPLRVYTEHTRSALRLPDYFTHRFEHDGRGRCGHRHRLDAVRQPCHVRDRAWRVRGHRGHRRVTPAHGRAAGSDADPAPSGSADRARAGLLARRA